MLTVASSAPSLTRLREAVRASKVAVGLVCLSGFELVDLSAPAATRLGIDTTDGAIELSALTTDPGSVRQAMSLIADGVLDACRIRTRLAVPSADDRVLLTLRAVDSDSEKLYAVAVFGAAGDAVDVLTGLEEPAAFPDDHRSRLAELERRFRRIAGEIAAAGVSGSERTDRGAIQFPGLEDLTDRQREILVRLLRGDRVPTISRGMHLATSTVRNHLTTVYRKVGVHSQAELIERLHSPNES
jgi:DNA-binding NarL/FixJ family response regulator